MVAVEWRLSAGTISSGALEHAHAARVRATVVVLEAFIPVRLRGVRRTDALR